MFSFYVTLASTARHLYLRGGVGVGAMIKIYGGRQRNGVCPAHFSVGSRNVARKVLQALEGLKMVEKDPNGARETWTGLLDKLPQQTRNSAVYKAPPEESIQNIYAHETVTVYLHKFACLSISAWFPQYPGTEGREMHESIIEYNELVNP
ncbi:hypothetical protein XENOCAPTIV_029381 [Xenoophorus captivus]|uniref:Small ribosomal subunit protein eS19 n=1 Tax=Xenoophorus captivus TaxID=1517983 RepID=A0ABV0RKL0_9TELE